MQTYSDIIILNVSKCYMPMKRVQWHNYLQYLFQTSAAFARKKMSNYCKLCKICVNQGKPSFEDAHMYVYVYIYIHVCLCMYM